LTQLPTGEVAILFQNKRRLRVHENEPDGSVGDSPGLLHETNQKDYVSLNTPLTYSGSTFFRAVDP